MAVVDVPPHTQPDPAEVRRRLEEQGVRFLLSSFVELAGVPKAKLVPLRHILAPAHDGVSLRKGFQLLAQGKSAVQHACETAGPLACREARTCFIPPACRGKPRDLALHQG